MRVLLDVSAVPARPVGAGVYTVALASRRPARLVWEQARGPALAERLRPDVWHGPHYTMPLRSPVPCVVTIHDLTFFDHPEWHERTKVVYFRKMIRAAAARAAVAVCVSAYTAGRLRAHVDPRAEVVVAHHGVDHDRFVASADASADRAALIAFGIEPPYIAFLSTIEPRKNVPTLVRAFARVAVTRPDLRLVLAGADGWGAREAREAIAASGVATQIMRPGYLASDAVAAFFRRAEVVAYPSFEEGFGLPVLEGLACGAPVVTATGSALAEVAGDAALLVAPDDPVALGDALARVLDDPALAARLRAAGPSRAAPFTWEACVDQHIDAYERAAKIGARA